MNKKQLTVKKLDINNLADVMKLQEKIISGLHPDEQHFILIDLLVSLHSLSLADRNGLKR